MSSESLRVNNVSKTYLSYAKPEDRLKQFLFPGRKLYREFHALSGVSFSVGKGEMVGIVGANGSGKSTLLQIICGTLSPSAGEVAVSGRLSALLELGAGFNPDFTGRENIWLYARVLGFPENEIRAKFDKIVEFSGIADHLDQPVRTYSSGMYVRLAFSVAVATDPDILVVDEALSVGDEAFQRKCFSRIEEIKSRGATILLVSHSASTVVETCDRAILLDGGEKLMEGPPRRVMSAYHKLIFSPADKRSLVREGIKGAPASAPQEAASSFVPGMTPESRVVYEPDGAEITGIRLTDEDENDANLLTLRRRYILTYRVKFFETAFKPRFGMMIKTTAGTELAGMGAEEDELEIIEAGSEAVVKFTFQCLMLPGTYFINCGCSAVKNGERVFLHRIVDALMLKTLPGGNEALGGVVDVMMQGKVDRV